MSNTSNKTHQIAITGVLCAVSFIAVLLSQVIPAVEGFLSYDPKDAIIVIAGFIYGPITSVVISLIVSFIEMITISGTGIYGFLMNVVSTCAFACPAALIYHRARRMRWAIVGLGVGMVSMTAVMLLWNYIITPLYMGVDRAVVVAMLPTVFLPFNLIKSGINAGLTMVLYKPIVGTLRRAKLLPEADAEHKGHFNLGFTLFSLAVLATFILLFLSFTGVI